MRLKEAKAFVDAIQQAVEAEYKRQVSIAIKQGIARKRRVKARQAD